MSPARPSTALRRAVLAVMLTSDAELATLVPHDTHVLLAPESAAPLTLSWSELALAAGDPREDVPEDRVRRRIARWLRLRLLLHDRVGEHAADGPQVGRSWVLARVRPRALPVGHALHPGDAWRTGRVLGGALDTGLALRGVDDDGRLEPEAVGLLPAPLLTAAGLDADAASERARRYLRDMAVHAADRMRRDATAVLRPLGDADVLTLLSSDAFRAALVEGTTMRSAAVPSRRRGWLDLGRLDPAFAVAAAGLTDSDERGFERAALITAEEVALARADGDPIRESLRDRAPDERSMPATRSPWL